MDVNRRGSGWRIVVGLFVLASVLLLSCGEDTDDAATGDDTDNSSTTSDAAADTSDTATASISVTDLDGRTFASTEVDGQELVDGTTIVIEFADGRVSVDAGCNGMGGPFSVEDGRLVAGELVSTMMACDEALMAQDQWVGELLASEPTVTLDGETLRLAGDDVTLVLAEEEPAPDAELVGPTWTVESVVTVDAVATMAGDPPTFTFHDDGMVDVFDGCNTLTAAYSRNGNGELVISTAEPVPPCPPDAPTDWHDAVAPLLAGEAVTDTIEGDTLSLRTADGSGWDLRADG